MATVTSGSPGLGRVRQSDLPFVDVTKPPYNAVGDGVTDCLAAFDAALAASDSVLIPPGTYYVSDTIVVQAHNKRLVGYGSGVSVVTGDFAGPLLSFTSGGGANPTLIRGGGSGFSLVGDDANTTYGLYVYDCAELDFSDVLCTDCMLDGVRMEIAISCTLRQCSSKLNGGSGFYVGAGTKSAVELRSNNNALIGCVGNQNEEAGLTLHRAYGNKAIGGCDFSSNVNGVLLSGAARNVLHGDWIESNSAGAVRSIQSASPTTFNAESNTIDSCLITGTDIQIENGNFNALINNFVGANIVISGGSATSSTRIYPQAYFAGTITDNGNATLNRANPASEYTKVSGALRYQRTIGTTVDFTSDIRAFRYNQTLGISATSTAANNLRGTVTLSGGTAAVTFPTAEANATYFLALSSDANETIRWSSKATGGFTVTSSNAGSTAVVDWILMR